MSLYCLGLYWNLGPYKVQILLGAKLPLNIFSVRRPIRTQVTQEVGACV